MGSIAVNKIAVCCLLCHGAFAEAAPPHHGIVHCAQGELLRTVYSGGADSVDISLLQLESALPDCCGLCSRHQLKRCVIQLGRTAHSRLTHHDADGAKRAFSRDWFCLSIVLVCVAYGWRLDECHRDRLGGMVWGFHCQSTPTTYTERLS